MSGSDLCIPRNETAHWRSLIISKQNYNVLSPNFSHLCICERFIFPGSAVSIIGRPILEIYKSLTNAWMYELEKRPRSFISGNASIGFSVQCILGYKVEHGVLSLQDVRRWVISSERGGGLLITLAIHLKQNGKKICLFVFPYVIVLLN